MKVLQQQHWHLLSLMILLGGIGLCVTWDSDFLRGELGGVSTAIWLVIAILTPILHQIYVLVCWRLELFYNRISAALGTDGFKLYKAGFAILFVLRLLTIIILAISNSNSLNLNTVLAYLLAGILFIPSVYLFYSVKKYFGMDRAFGIDHFDPDRLKEVPFVRKGMFKYSSNAMYTFGFLILWVPGLLLLSKAAILAGLFNHVYIWVHYFFTEAPDMKVIYGTEAVRLTILVE